MSTKTKLKPKIKKVIPEDKPDTPNTSEPETSKYVEGGQVLLNEDENAEEQFELDPTFEIDGQEGYDEDGSGIPEEYMMDSMGMHSQYFPPEELIRQQQLATFQMLYPLFIYNDKNVPELLSDIRVSLDCLSKVVLELNNTVASLAKEREQISSSEIDSKKKGNK